MQTAEPDPSADHPAGPFGGDAGPGPSSALRFGLIAVVTLVAFESLAVITILPEVEDDLGGLSWYGWVTTAFFLGTMLGIVYAGDQADRRGAGRPYLAGLVLFAGGLLLGGLAPSMPWLVAGRFIQGFGAGVVPAIGYIAIGRVFSAAERPRMFALLSTAWVVPGIVGPVLAERVTAATSWRWVFLGLLPLVVVAGTFVLPPISRLGPSDTAALDPAGGRRRMLLAVRVAAGAAVIIAALDARPILIPPAVVAGLVVGLGALRQLVPPGTLRAGRGMPATVLSRGMLTFAFLGTDTFIPYAITNGRGRSSFAGSVSVTATTLAWTMASWAQQRGIARRGERVYVRTGYLVLAPSIAIVAVGAVPSLVPYWAIHVGWAFAGLGMGLAYSAHAQQLLRLSPPGAYGAATSSLQLFDNLGVAIGSGIVGAVVSAGVDRGWTPGSSAATAFAIPAVVAAAGFLVASRLDPGRAADDHEPDADAVIS